MKSGVKPKPCLPPTEPNKVQYTPSTSTKHIVQGEIQKPVVCFVLNEWATDPYDKELFLSMQDEGDNEDDDI